MDPELAAAIAEGDAMLEDLGHALGNPRCTDSACPCQDGDACHYEDVGDSPAWRREEIPDAP